MRSTFTFTSGNLGIANFELGEYEKAKELFERALKTDEQHYGQDHFDVSRSLENLGNAHRMLGEYDRAEELLEWAFNIKVRQCGQDHVEVAVTLYNLALVHGKLGEHEKAAEMWERVLLVYKDHFGFHHDRCTKVRRAIDWASFCVSGGRWVVGSPHRVLYVFFDSAPLP